MVKMFRESCMNIHSSRQQKAARPQIETKRLHGDKAILARGFQTGPFLPQSDPCMGQHMGIKHFLNIQGTWCVNKWDKHSVAVALPIWTALFRKLSVVPKTEHLCSTYPTNEGKF
ncbi:hypothetical protein ISCGN_027572 [Ixodes scapularis]